MSKTQEARDALAIALDAGRAPEERSAALGVANELRKELGDDEFWAVARSWLADHDNTSVSRAQAYDHWEEETGRELSIFFDRWITGERTPAPGVPDA